MEDREGVEQPSSILHSPSSPSSSASRPWLIGLLIIGILAVAMMTAATRWGIGISKDSVRYLKTARQSLGLEEKGWTTEAIRDRSHFPPLYPAVLAAVGSLPRSEPLIAARWVSVVLFAVNAMLAGVIIR